MSWLRRKSETVPVVRRTVDEERAAYIARFGSDKGIDWAVRYERERNRRDF